MPPGYLNEVSVTNQANANQTNAQQANHHQTTGPQVDVQQLQLGTRFWEHSPLVLTATIHVASGLPDSPVADPVRRASDYLRCLQFYLDQPSVSRIVFAENSGADLTHFHALAASATKPVEVLGLDHNTFPVEFGKGYGEAALMDHVLGTSKQLDAAPSFMKATGRLLVRNIDALVQTIDARASAHFDVRDHDWHRRLGLNGTAHHTDTRFFVVHRALFDAHFRHLHSRHTSGTFSIEASYLTALRDAQRAGWLIRDRFYVEPIYGGVAGHGKDYDSLRERSKRAVRRVARRWLPSLKI